MAIPVITVRPTDAANAYRGAASGQFAVGGGGFAGALQSALQDAIGTLGKAETTAAAGIAGTANVTDVVTAVSKAELALQTAMTIRDRVVQAYQDIIKMPI